MTIPSDDGSSGSPNTSDGYYAGAGDALIDGVVAAKGEIRKDGLNQRLVSTSGSRRSSTPAQTRAN
jgi:hypothetical protein